MFIFIHDSKHIIVLHVFVYLRVWKQVSVNWSA